MTTQPCSGAPHAAEAQSRETRRGAWWRVDGCGVQGPDSAAEPWAQRRRLTVGRVTNTQGPSSFRNVSFHDDAARGENSRGVATFSHDLLPGVCSKHSRKSKNAFLANSVFVCCCPSAASSHGLQ